jgi:ribonuclease HI
VDADIVVYTDGSASEGNKEGGAAAVITCGDVVADVILKRGRVLTCSYEEEKEALELVLNWIDETGIEDKAVLIATDSQSLCQALLGSDPELAVLRNRIQTSLVRIVVQWIPGHSEITGNEVADAAAKAATTLEGSPGAISYKSVASYINRMIKDPPIEHKRTKKVYSKLSKKTETLIKSRDDEVLLAQLRSGKHKVFGDYKLKLDPNADTSCPHCKAPDFTLVHWLTKCKKIKDNRKRLFGRMNPGLSVLTSHPLQTILLARETLPLEGGTSTGDATPADSRQ